MLTETEAMDHPRLVLLCPLLAALALSAGCGRSAGPDATRLAPAAPTTAEAAPPASERHRMVGVVRGVDAQSGVVTIRHEEMPGFMKAMTMPFDVEDRTVLEDLQVGDEVEGTLVVTGNESRLVDLQVTKPATAPTLSLDLRGGTPQLRVKAERLEPGQMVPDFQFTTQEGTKMSLSDLRGKVVALTFIYTRCPLPDFCPALDRKFATMADRIEARPGRSEGIRLLSISFDPEHDTPEVLRKHAEIQGARPPLWTFAVAEHVELRKVAESLGLVYGPTKDEVIHNRCVAVIAPDGTLARLEVGEAGRTWTPAELLKTVYALIPESAE